MRYDCVELVPRKHVVPEYGRVVINPGDDWRSGIPYREGDFANWCVEVGKPRNLGLLLKCACSYISKKNMLTFWDMFGEIFGQPMRIATTNSPDESERARVEHASKTWARRSGDCSLRAPTLRSRKAAAATLTTCSTAASTAVTRKCQRLFSTRP